MHVINDQGEPEECDDVKQWALFMRDENRIVEQTMVGTVKVSTVFLGLDHSFTDGPPMLWETMVFGGFLDGEQDRYATLEDAKHGHGRMLAEVKESTQ